MGTDRMQRQRFEMKYILGEERALQVREFVQSYLSIDENGIGKPHLSYPVHSLYLDSDHLATYWATVNGDKNRFKLRMRFYNSDPTSPVFLEIKRRVDNCILKQRGGVRKEAVPLLLAGQLPGPEHLLSRDGKQLVAVQRFCELMESIQATPKVHVAYLREAWVDPESDRVRVTFDREVQGEYEPLPRFCTRFREEPVNPFRNQVILEIKFTNRFPDWANALVERFDLWRTGAAKYCECIDLIDQRRDEPGFVPGWETSP